MNTAIKTINSKKTLNITLILFSAINIIYSALQCHNGLKMFSVERGNVICAPFSSYECINSCEWNTTCALTSHYVAFRGRRTYISGLILTNNTFLVQCCASFSSILQMNAQQEPKCVWIDSDNTVKNFTNIKFDLPLSNNEYIRDIKLIKKENDQVQVKTEICKFIEQRRSCAKSKMTVEESRFFTLLQLRLEKTKNLLNFSNSNSLNLEKPIYLNSLKNITSVSPLLTHKESIINKTNSERKSFNNELVDTIDNTLLNSFQLSILKNLSDSTKNYAFKTDSIPINYSNLFKKNLIVDKEIIVEKPKLYGTTSKNNLVSISPKIHIIKVPPNTKKNSTKNFIKQKENLLHYIARDAVEEFNYNEISPRKIWIKGNNISNQSRYNLYNQINHVAKPTNNLWTNDKSLLFRKVHTFSRPDELSIKNNLQIQKIENFSNEFQRLVPKRIITRNFEKLYPQKNLFTKNHYRKNKNYKNEIEKSKFRVAPLNNLISKTKIISRPTLTFIQHQQKKITQNNKLEIKSKFLNEKDQNQKQSELLHNFESFHKIKQNSLPNQDSAAFYGLLNCCKQQAPNCKHLCSKNVSKEEIKQAFVTNQCAPLSMTSVIQCFPRFYNVSSVTQCCNSNTYSGSTKNTYFDDTNLNNPFKPMPTKKMPEQCLSLCAPDFKLSFAHFACIDHISTIVECYQNLLK